MNSEHYSIRKKAVVAYVNVLSRLKGLRKATK
jgi:hypothetical protein